VKKPAFAGFFSQPPDGHATPEYWASCCGDFHTGTEISQAALQTAIDIDPPRRHREGYIYAANGNLGG
jgi:hypothetical protein